ncbi:MAG: chemotaxis protein CheW [Alcanivoracaceae bacterium]
MSDSKLFCTFHVGDQHYGVPVEDVQEVLSGAHITGMPLSPPAILGLMNIRGQIVPAVAMRRVLTDQHEVDMESAMNVVVRHDGAEISLVVDSIDDVIDVQLSSIERTPDTLKRSLKRYIRGVAQMTNELLLILDVHAVLADDRCRKSQEQQLYKNPILH